MKEQLGKQKDDGGGLAQAAECGQSSLMPWLLNLDETFSWIALRPEEP